MIGERIKELRKIKQLNQQELALALDMKQSTIANYEKETRTPNLETLIQMADYFGLTLDDLVGREKRNYDDIIRLSDDFLNYLLNDQLLEAETLMKSYMETGDIHQVYYKLLRYALTKLGWLWEVGAITIAKEHQISYEISRMIANLSSNFKNKHDIIANDIKVLGMAVPGEKHNIGLKMLMSSLEVSGFESLYIGEAVPIDDLKRQLKEGEYDCLVLSITNVHLRDRMTSLIDQLENIKIIVVGNGAIDIKEKIETYQSYEKCLEALLCQEEELMKEKAK
jgi:transcriptional regulator with XRE-family HTH domain